MLIRQRLVRFGTTFRSNRTDDRVDERNPAPHELCRNELAVDVGSTCWGWLRPGSQEPETLRVIDHHFQRNRQYPSASAAVLALDRKIHEWASSLPADVEQIWVATHQQPDFDALCAITLVEDIVVHGPSSTADAMNDWFKPDLARIESAFQWRYQLAAVASITDQCKRPLPPRSRTLPAMLYACEQRGASLRTDEFRRRFFGVVRRELAHGRNALTDSVLEYVDEFQGEREFLDRQDAAYSSDLRRARRAVVSVP